MSKFFRNKWWIGVLVVVVGGLFYLLKQKAENSPVRTATVERKKFQKSVMLNGNLEPIRKTIVIAPFNGFIRQVHVKVGQKVQAGDPVVTLTQSMSGSEPIHPIRSGISGRVVQVLHWEGEYMKADDPNGYILRIDDQSKYFIDAYVPELIVSFMSVGQSVDLTSSALTGRTFKGRIKEISEAPRVQEGWRNQGKVEYLVRIELLTKSDDLFSGLSFAGQVITAEKNNVLILPMEFIFKDKDDYFVFDEKRHRKLVHIGLVSDRDAEILDGVSEGEKVRSVDMVELLGDVDAAH
jgi:multidrug efflux pump subunit AcrA (membrane-fusion protein)